jgi:DNA-binding MarR family transcriptional regulator
MNNESRDAQLPREQSDDYRSFLLLDEISRDNKVTQRTLSKRLGLALGLVNSYIKNLAAKGYISVTNAPPRRYAYFLTPKGFFEKSRLAYRHLHNFTNLYRFARQDFQRLFRNLYEKGIRSIVFCGVDEITEIAYLSLQEVDIGLTAVVDVTDSRRRFFEHNIEAIDNLKDKEFDMVVITSFSSGDKLKEELLKRQISEEKICDISSGGWLKKIK